MFDHSDNQVSALTDAINRFGERDLEILFDDEGQASTIEVHRSIERLRLIGEIDRRQTYTVAGHPSTASWLAATCRPAWGHARRLVAGTRRGPLRGPKADGDLEFHVESIDHRHCGLTDGFGRG